MDTGDGGVGSLAYERLVELCRQEPPELESRLQAATAEAIRSIKRSQGSSVAQLPRAFGDVENPLELVPFLRWQNVDFGGDGGWEKTTQGDVSSLRRPLLQSVQRDPSEAPHTDGGELHPYKQPLPGTVISSLPAYRRMGTLAQSIDGVRLIGAMTAAA